MVWEIVSSLAPLWVALSRGVVGWARNSLEDGKIDAVEWKKLGKNLLVLLAVGGLLNQGFDVTWAEGTSTYAVFDMGLSEWKRLFKK